MGLKSTEHSLRKCMRKLLREKKLEQITIVELCELAGIGKRTFYRYYPDKYALLEDIYKRDYFGKLGITDTMQLYEIFEKMAEQMYEDRTFFLQLIGIKGQNGFWTVVSDLLLPYFINQLVNDPSLDQDRDFYTRRDIEILLHFLENWIRQGCQISPGELVEHVRLCNAVHGKWEYQLATGQKPEEFNIEKFRKNEW